MLPNTKALLAFAGRFLLIFFLILPLWHFTTPLYNRLLATSGNMVLALVEDPHVTTLVGWKNNIAIVRSDTISTGGMRVKGFTGYLTHFNLILMVALVLSPRGIPWRRRFKILPVALGILFVVHVLYLLIGVKFLEQPELEALQGITGRLSVWGVNFYLSIVSQLLPVLIWMALYRTFTPISVEQDVLEETHPAGRESG